MKNQMDKLFKEKLESHSLPPSDEAWARVEAKLSKKNNVVAWRIAAAILLLGAFISVMYWQQATEKPAAPTLAITPAQKENKEAATTSQDNKPAATTDTKKTSQPSVNQSIRKQHDMPVAQHIEEIEKKEESAMPVVIESQKENAVALMNEQQEEKEKEKISTNATSTATIASSTQKPIKLEFTLDDFASEEKVVATTEVKNSGLKRVLELAKEVKNGEGPVNDLREMKRDLFAFNFIKNKTKN